jgi:hypothetical protein
MAGHKKNRNNFQKKKVKKVKDDLRENEIHGFGAADIRSMLVEERGGVIQDGEVARDVISRHINKVLALLGLAKSPLMLAKARTFARDHEIQEYMKRTKGEGVDYSKLK